MPLNDEAQSIFRKHNGIPLVGLINKKTHEIIFAPCIPEKVRLTIDTNGNATSAYFMNDDLSKLKDCSKSQLEHYNSLLQEKFVPRLATTPSSNLKSSHEFLFEQYNLTDKSEWGGFAVTAEPTGNLKYTFASGAFNSPPNQRIKGAQLSENLQAEVKQQIDSFSAELLDQTHHTPENIDQSDKVSTEELENKEEDVDEGSLSTPTSDANTDSSSTKKPVDVVLDEGTDNAAESEIPSKPAEIDTKPEHSDEESNISSSMIHKNEVGIATGTSIPEKIHQSDTVSSEELDEYEYEDEYEDNMSTPILHGNTDSSSTEIPVDVVLEEEMDNAAESEIPSKPAEIETKSKIATKTVKVSKAENMEIFPMALAFLGAMSLIPPTPLGILLGLLVILLSCAKSSSLNTDNELKASDPIVKNEETKNNSHQIEDNPNKGLEDTVVSQKSSSAHP